MGAGGHRGMWQPGLHSPTTAARFQRLRLPLTRRYSKTCGPRLLSSGAGPKVSQALSQDCVLGLSTWQQPDDTPSCPVIGWNTGLETEVGPA